MSILEYEGPLQIIATVLNGIPSWNIVYVFFFFFFLTGNCLEFEGGKVELLHFNNWFGSHVSEFTISFWYKWLNALPGLPQGLVHNGNCVTEPTIDIIINTNDNIKGSVNTEPGINMEVWVAYISPLGVRRW